MNNISGGVDVTRQGHGLEPPPPPGRQKRPKPQLIPSLEGFTLPNVPIATTAPPQAQTEEIAGAMNLDEIEEVGDGGTAAPLVTPQKEAGSAGWESASDLFEAAKVRGTPKLADEITRYDSS